MSITVTQDIVEATGVGVDRATFYPVVDTYLDKLGIKGNRLERASVAVSIYSPGGTRVRTLSKAIGTGRYSIAWDGRNSGGTLLAAGRYRIVQTLTDAYGTRKSFTAYSTISRRKMIFTTYTRTVSGRSYAASGTSGSGSVSQGASNFANGVRISGSSGWAAVGYQFTVPAAQFYKTVTFKLQGWSGVPPGNIGLQDWGDCASAGTWNEDCFGAWRSIGSSTAWYPTSGTSSHVSDRRVRGIARVETGMIDIANVAVVVVYGNLD